MNERTAGQPLPRRAQSRRVSCADDSGGTSILSHPALAPALLALAFSHPLFQEYDRGVKVKTSVTLSAALVKTIDRSVQAGESRSEVIERLLHESLAARTRQAADARDRAILDAHAADLNREAEDVLDYQVDL